MLTVVVMVIVEVTVMMVMVLYQMVPNGTFNFGTRTQLGESRCYLFVVSSVLLVSYCWCLLWWWWL